MSFLEALELRDDLLTLQTALLLGAVTPRCVSGSSVVESLVPL